MMVSKELNEVGVKMLATRIIMFLPLVILVSQVLFEILIFYSLFNCLMYINFQFTTNFHECF